MDAFDRREEVTRRTFLKLGVLAGVFGLGGKVALAAIKEDLAESDPAAVALGYKKDASTVDAAKFPKGKDAAKKNQVCKACMFYKPGTDGKGQCTLFSNKLVMAGGWCNSWAKKA